MLYPKINPKRLKIKIKKTLIFEREYRYFYNLVITKNSSNKTQMEQIIKKITNKCDINRNLNTEKAKD